MKFLNFFLFVLCGLGTIVCDDSVNGDIVNSRVQRTVDLTTHLVKINSRITVENTGKTASRQYLIAIDPVLTQNVSFIGAAVSIDKCMLHLTSLLFGSCL